jgi:hypothetical protein
VSRRLQVRETSSLGGSSAIDGAALRRDRADRDDAISIAVMRSIIILGSTGSVGRQALEVVQASEDLRVVGLAVGRSWREVVDAAVRHQVGQIAIADRQAGPPGARCV